MKITMMKIMNIRNELEALFMKDVPIEASWAISKFIRQIEVEYNDFEKNRVKILKKYIDEETGKVPEDKQNELQKEMENLLDVEVELDIRPIPINALGDVSVPPLSLAKMSFLFTEPEFQDNTDVGADNDQ